MGREKGPCFGARLLQPCLRVVGAESFVVYVLLFMMSDATIDRFYYIFDSREQRALVLDRATGEEVAWGTVPRVQLIEHVKNERSPSALRHFARWCARQTGIETVPSKGPAAQLWTVAQSGEAAAWRTMRGKVTDAVVRAAALGLPQGHSAAARLLVVHACTHPDAYRAAVDAAHMSERWVEFEAEETPEAAVRALRRRHVNWLLDALNVPTE